MTLLSLFHWANDIYRRNAAFILLTALGHNSLIVVLTTTAFFNAIELTGRFAAPCLGSTLSVANPMCALTVLYTVFLIAFLLDRRKIYVMV